MDNFRSAALLAGGKSRRMGFDKQLFHVVRNQLFAGVLQTLTDLFEDVMVVTEYPKMYCDLGMRPVLDIIPGLGPLSGIHAALREAKSEYVYIIACDMPKIDPRYITYLMQRITAFPFAACVTKKGDWLEPFHAFYGKQALPIIETDLYAGKSSVYYLLQKINTLYIKESQARRFTPDWSLFLNLNTPRDLIVTV